MVQRNFKVWPFLARQCIRKTYIIPDPRRCFQPCSQGSTESWTRHFCTLLHATSQLHLQTKKKTLWSIVINIHVLILHQKTLILFTFFLHVLSLGWNGDSSDKSCSLYSLIWGHCWATVLSIFTRDVRSFTSHGRNSWAAVTLTRCSNNESLQTRHRHSYWPEGNTHQLQHQDKSHPVCSTYRWSLKHSAA